MSAASSKERNDAEETTPHVFGPEHEPSTWLRTESTALLREINALGLLGLPAVILVPLSPHGTPSPGDREDRTCDRCRVYTEVGDLFYPFLYSPVVDVVLVVGLCADCARREFGK